MKVLVYGCPDAGPKVRCLALIVVDGKVQPVYHFGATASEARGKAQKWWNGEIERQKKRNAPKPRKSRSSAGSSEGAGGAEDGSDPVCATAEGAVDD